MKKTLASLALAGILTLSAGAVAAQAAPNYPAEGSATVSETTVVPGQALTFAGSGFAPGETIDVTVTQTSAVAGGAIGSLGGGVSMSKPLIVKAVAPSTFTTVATAAGTFSTPVTLNATGTYTLTAVGRVSGNQASQVVKVVTSLNAGSGAGNNVANAEKGGLANTGIDTSVVIWSLVGAGALAAGVGTVVVSRRRSRQSA
ncbi:LPXTG cell wall anchor domain-containing protein [Arthrobacter glacialis]|uniref:LPXTG cell wall anchor domain-containing protein n=1 Tax=Arthrobacter glacialis TaxID=1664 RepID=UPI000CD3E10B|nr:LPXTG cell wall anchor domain-containing protein [Arthrobacter glacialis]POH60674.1 peptidase [Arthrobacter glacialis]